jgi:hypothetical protein
MLNGSAGCIGRWNHLDENGPASNRTFPCNASFLGKRSQNWHIQGNWIALPTGFSWMPGTKSTRFPVRTLLIRLYEQIDWFSIKW